MDELLRDFIIETNQHLEEAATQLVLFERDPTDASLIAKIFRLVHTIKGTCSFLGLTRLQHIAHAGETMIGELRNGAAPTQSSVTVVLAAIDRIKQIVEEVERSGVEPEGDDNDMIAELDAQAAILAASLAAAAAPAAATSPAEAPAAAPPEAAAVAAPPEVHAPAPVVAKAPPAKGPAAPAKGPAAANARSSETIRVAVDAIERMMQLVSELVLTRNQLLELTRHRQDDTVKSPLQRLSSLTTDLQDAVMRARMQPVERLYANLPRLIRELATECGKKIDLVTEGADTELDRQLIEILRDPLTHMIRNSADHGLETPSERAAAGKPETGEIRVAASHEAGQITITISDDGRGLDIEKIKKKLITNGTVTEAEVAKLSEDEIFKFIFAPGFSTAKTVTNVSGRGVGMDVVRSNIESIGGSISLQSKLGKGTKFSMRIPLTLAIAPALIVEAAGQRFALPQHAVVEAVGVGQNSGHVIDKVQNALVLRLREEVVPVIDMSQVLGLAQADRENTEQLVVIMRVGGESFGVIVDKVADVQEVVVKPLSASLAHLKVFTGHTILGDGSVVLILDPGGLAMSIGIEKSGDKKRDAKKDVAGADKMRLVLFRAGAGVVKVLPVSLIARIEMVEPGRIEHADGRLTMIHQDRLMPLVPVGSTNFETSRSYPVLVITDGDLTVGLLVDEIVDIIEETLDVQLSSGGYDTIGAAVIRGHAVEFIDVTSYLQGVASSMTRQTQKQSSRSQVLLVHNDAFARDFLSPMLAAAGYRVTAASSAKEALQIIDQGSHVDAVVTSTELGEMTSNELMSAVRRSQATREVPVIGLLGSDEGYDESEGDELTMRVQASDRQSLLAGLSSALKAMQRAEKRSASKSKNEVAA
ncbi:MAG: chemotaxis protein CheW [Hyphomicrobiaceae bacterium]|nr:chemotaxis protein CheW [Hyphomicrobiaceae bacterium]